MRVELHNGLRSPMVVEATRVLIRDGKHNNPICLAVECSEAIFVAQCDDPEFQRYLKTFGINQTVIVATHVPEDIREIQF